MARRRRLQGAQLLVVNMGALAAELCKNLVLAGIGGLTIMDDAVVTEDALCAQFLIDAADVGTKTVGVPARRWRPFAQQPLTLAVGVPDAGGVTAPQRAEASFNRLRDLNPRVQLAVEPGRLSDKPDAFFTRFNAVCLTQATTEEIVRRRAPWSRGSKRVRRLTQGGGLDDRGGAARRGVQARVDAVCRAHRIAFFAGSVYGFVGYLFNDIGRHEYIPCVPRPRRRPLHVPGAC